MPGYLKLCMRTWRRFLPEYDMVVLNYSNIDQWLGKACYDASLYTNFSLPKQADAVRCAVLKRWGGVWFDIDTIVTSEKIRGLLRSDAAFTLLDKHLCFVMARKNAAILRMWEKGIRLHIALYAWCRGDGYLAGRMRKFLGNYLERWDFLGNLPLKIPLKIAEHISAAAFSSIDKMAINAFPELSIGCGADVIEKYVSYYFSDASGTCIEYAVNNGGMLCLHNSWTPAAYMRMDEEEFLSQDIVLTKILRHLLLP